MARFVAKITFPAQRGTTRSKANAWRCGHRMNLSTPHVGTLKLVMFCSWPDSIGVIFQTVGMTACPTLESISSRGVQHAEAGTEQFEYLALKAVRICVSPEVAEAICATGRVNGPVITISNGIEALFSTSKSARLPVTIAGCKDPKLAQDLANRLAAMGIENRCLTEFIPRESFLDLLSHSRVVVCLPKVKEGFYLPALEAMGLGCMVVTVDCIGNRSFCFNERNCLIAERNVDSLAEATSRALNTGIMKRWRMGRKAMSTTRQHSLSKERSQFHRVLKDIDRLWASTM